MGAPTLKGHGHSLGVFPAAALVHKACLEAELRPCEDEGALLSALAVGVVDEDDKLGHAAYADPMELGLYVIGQSHFVRGSHGRRGRAVHVVAVVVLVVIAAAAVAAEDRALPVRGRIRIHLILPASAGGLPGRQATSAAPCRRLSADLRYLPNLVRHRDDDQSTSKVICGGRVIRPLGIWDERAAAGAGDAEPRVLDAVGIHGPGSRDNQNFFEGWSASERPPDALAFHLKEAPAAAGASVALPWRVRDRDGRIGLHRDLQGDHVQQQRRR